MIERSRFWTAVVLTMVLSACRGGVSTIPAPGAFAPSADAREPDGARKAITITVSIPLPSKAGGLSGAVFPQGMRTKPIATFTVDLGAKGRCVESKAGERICSTKIHVRYGGPYDLAVQLHRTFPIASNARVLAAAVVGFYATATRPKALSFATGGELAKPSVLLGENGIHSFDPATLFATVSGLDRFGNVLIVKRFTGAGGASTPITLASTLPDSVLALHPAAFAKSSTNDATFTYHPEAALSTLVKDGANIAVTASVRGSKAKSIAKVRILAPRATSVLLSNPGAQPSAITLGPDGALWFCEFGTGKIGRITTDLKVTGEYGDFPHPQSIASAGGALWVAQNDGAGNIDRIATNGTTTVYPLPVNTYPNGISAGPSGQLWFGSVQNNYVGTISTSGTYGLQFTLPAANSYPLFSTLGPDGNQYFVLNGTGQILKISQSGAILGTFNEPGSTHSPQNIVSGPDGKLWFSDTGQRAIFSMTTTGRFKTFTLPLATPPSGPLAFGPDGKLWYTAENGLGRLDTANGTAIGFGLIIYGGSFGIALAPNGAFYVTENGTAQISKLQ